MVSPLDPDYFVTLLAGAGDAPHTAPPTADHAGPDRFFGKNGLLHATLRSDVLDVGPVATGPARTLWHYRSGVWLAYGDDEVRRRVRRLLGERWRKAHAEGVVSDLAANEPFITDAQPTRWINVRNGLLDWRTGELHPHSPAVPTTYQLGVEWDPSATCPTIDAWLDQVVPADAIPLVWEVFGTAVYADQPFHRAILLLGPGRNGKGTFLRLVTRMIGAEHVASVTLQELGENRFAAADLFGKVANISGDLDSRALQRSDLFKMATGGDRIMAEHKYGQRFGFTNRATMIFSANEPPGSLDHTDGFLARFVVIPFTRLLLPRGAEDPTIEPRLASELPGALVRAVAGLRAAMERPGFDQPASVLAATDGYGKSIDPLRQFLDACVNVTGDANERLARSDLYTRYKAWCEENCARPLGAGRFWTRLAAIEPRIDHQALTIRGTRMTTGASLREDWR